MSRPSVCTGIVLAVLLGIAATSSTAAPSQPPPISNRPAATLLLPYFEVDLDNPQGQTTLFSINNASATAVMAHVVLWSDMGIPVFGFNLYLTGYDMHAINLRDIFNGMAPLTASAGQDPANTISFKGPISQDINFASCTGILPAPSIPAVYLPYLRAALTGNPSSFHNGQCVARNHNTPSLARGYVTVNTTTQCSLMFPSDPGYFSGVASYQNVLWGDYQYINPSQELAYGEPLVQIVSSNVDADLITPGKYTFWGRFVAWTAADRREPLSTNFAAPFVAAKDFKTVAKARRRNVLPASTEVIVWRDPKVASVNSFACNTKPGWFPLVQEHLRIFDEQEQTEVPNFGSSPPFPGATQRVTMATSALPTTFYSGWVFLNLNQTNVQAGANPPSDPAASQAWVTVLHRVLQGPNGGRYEVGFRATRLDSARAASHLIIP